MKLKTYLKEGKMEFSKKNYQVAVKKIVKKIKMMDWLSDAIDDIESSVSSQLFDYFDVEPDGGWDNNITYNEIYAKIKKEL